MESRLCLLNAGPTGTETIKNLVLPGCGHVTVVDGGTVTRRDLANNFFVSHAHLGQSRAQATLELLLEMNDDVKGAFVARDPVDLLDSDPSFFDTFSLVIATQMPQGHGSPLSRLAAYLWERNIPLLVVRSYGLVGVVRVVRPEHRVLEGKLDSQVPDLRIADPWPELRAYVDAIDLDAADDMTHSHVPYVAVLIKAIDAWKASHGGAGPRGSDKVAFRALVESMRRETTTGIGAGAGAGVGAGAGAGAGAGSEGVSDGVGSELHEANFEEALGNLSYAWAVQPVPQDVRDVLDDAAAASLGPATPDYWFVVAAIRDFVSSRGGHLPVPGSLPDMTASTTLYVALQRLYAAKAEQDLEDVKTRVQALRTAAGVDPAGISAECIHNMCKNARQLRVLRFTSLEEEAGFGEGVKEALADAVMEAACLVDADAMAVDGEDDDEDESEAVKNAQQAPVSWYLALRGVDEFVARHGRYPGETDEALEADAEELWAVTKDMLTKAGVEVPPFMLSSKHAAEMARYGGAELHTTAAFLGGVASQEAVKIITNQYIPLQSTFVFNGIACMSSTLRL
jgi:amyloid beta precursor protein binding protein 1